MKYAITFGAAVAPLVSAHGLLTSPTPRSAGSAMESVCGQQIYNNMAADAYGNIQGEQQLEQSDFTDACNLWLCKGFQFSDNSANVQSYTTGQTVDMKFDIRAPHTGTANVSVVDTSTNTVIGDALASWSVFASNSGGDTSNQTSFSITIPDLGGKCTTAGDCVIQHYWNSDSAGQTYESCVDFTVGGSSSSSSSSSGSSSSAAASSAAVSVIFLF
jgi:predicted carbohydrate-binding protein with CBM5 and CBM33 domain